MEAHKPTAETISSSRGSNCPPKCQWIGSSSEEMELCAQMGAHTAPPPADNGSEMVCVFARVCVRLRAQASRRSRIRHSLYLGTEGHPCMCLICVHVCVSEWESAA